MLLHQEHVSLKTPLPISKLPLPSGWGRGGARTGGFTLTGSIGDAGEPAGKSLQVWEGPALAAPLELGRGLHRSSVGGARLPPIWFWTWLHPAAKIFFKLFFFFPPPFAHPEKLLQSSPMALHATHRPVLA